jgi:hypothetical protein
MAMMLAMFGVGPLEILLLLVIVVIAGFFWSKSRGK